MIKLLTIALFICSNVSAQLPPFFDSCKINRLHNRGIYGNDIKIAVIGTGCNIDTAITNITYVDFTGTVPGDSMSHCGPIIHAGAARYIGIAPGVHVYSLKIYNTDANPHCTQSTLIAALDYCLANGIRIATNSIAIGLYAGLNAKMTECWNAGITLFMSSGNNPGTNIVQTAQCDSVISVGARDFTLGFINSYLTSHNKVQISGTNFGQTGGTSQASSTFAFIAALILQRYPTYTPLQIKVALQSVCTKWISPYEPTYTNAEGITMSNLIGAGYFNTFIY